MMKALYKGEFASREGRLWRVEILRDGATGEPAELMLRGSEPLVIEWEDKDKEETICSSSATLGLLSPGDRTYTGLYTTKACSTRLDVYRDGALYWSGTLDTETYEEPYTYRQDYEVELTFSDFGELERLKMEKSDELLTIEEILKKAIGRMNISYTSIDTSMISSRLKGAKTALKLSDIAVRGDNFRDSDGERKTLKETIEGILQPLGLRMIQRAGRIWIYDLNGLAESGKAEKIEWMSTDQMLSTDKAANNVRITFSPNAKAKISRDISYTGSKGETGSHGSGEGYRRADIHGTDDWDGTGWDAENISMRMLTSKIGRGVGEMNYERARYFCTVPLLSGGEEEGIALLYTTIVKGKDGKLYQESWSPKGVSSLALKTETNNSSIVMPSDGSMVMRSGKMYLPPLSEDEALKYKIRIKIGLMMEARWNPWEEESDDNRRKESTNMKTLFNVAVLKTHVRLLDDSGTLKAAWDNQNGYGKGEVLRLKQGSWKTGTEASQAVCRLEYYDKDDPYDGSAVGTGGFAYNRPSMGSRGSETGNQEKAKLGAWMQKAADGEYISYPAQGGRLEVEVMSGIGGATWVHKKGHNNNYWRQLTVEKGDYKMITWLLMSGIKVEIVKGGLKAEDAESDDIEYSGRIDADAKESIDIDTICGDMRSPLPTARGLYLRSSDGLPIGEIERAGHTDIAERLLIGTLCSQYGSRHIKLSGTAKMGADWGQWTRYADGGTQSGKTFLLTSSVEDLAADESEIVVRELSADEYQAAAADTSDEDED